MFVEAQQQAKTNTTIIKLDIGFIPRSGFAMRSSLLSRRRRRRCLTTPKSEAGTATAAASSISMWLKPQ